MLINYVDLPDVPEDLLDPTEEIIANAGKIGILTENVWAASRVNDRLVEWCLKNVSPNVSPIYQLIYPAVPVHRDQGVSIATNYIIKAGGPNVVTAMYDDDMNRIEAVCIKERKWHTMEVDHLHGVENIVESPRISLKLCFTDKNPFLYLKSSI